MSLLFAKVLPATIHLLHTRKSYLILEAFGGGELFLLFPRDFVCFVFAFLLFSLWIALFYNNFEILNAVSQNIFLVDWGLSFFFSPRDLNSGTL